MSDYFVNRLDTMEVGESVDYHAASPESRDKVLAILSAQKFSVNVQDKGDRQFKITITRKA